MVKKLPEYVEMFSVIEMGDRPLIITLQIEEHFVRLESKEPGYDILIDSLRDIPFELLRYAADEEIHLALKYYKEEI